MQNSSYNISFNISIFTNGINLASLQQYLLNSSLGSNFIGFEIINQNVIFYFINTLSSDNITTLTTLLNTYNGKPLSYPTWCAVTPYIFYNQPASNNNTICSSFIYDGTFYTRITQILILTQMFGEGSYNITVFDKINNLVINSITGLNNTQKQIISLNNNTNMPTNLTFIEIMVSVNFGYVVLYDMKVYYE